MMTWHDYEEMAKIMKVDGSDEGISNVEAIIAKLSLGFRPARAYKINSVFSLEYFKEELTRLSSFIQYVVKIPLAYYGEQIKESNEQLYIAMLFLKHESITLYTVSKRLDTDAQLFDVWRNFSSFREQVDKCIELTPGGVFKEEGFDEFFMIEGEAPSWSLWAEDLYYEVKAYNLDHIEEFMMERVRAVLALKPEENIKALEKSAEEIQRLETERRKLERENRGMLDSLKKGRRR
jgi:hypothetical protein